MATKKKSYTKIALTLSLCLLILWGILGTGASLAWFTDTTPVQKNMLNIGELDLAVSYRLEDGSYKDIDSETDIFDRNALYEPGYVQVIYLKVENKGNVPFDYKTAVTVVDHTPAINTFGQSFDLQDYLRFGVVTADTEEELMQKIPNREAAKNNATADFPLNTFTTDVSSLGVTSEDYVAEEYLALIVRMPEEVNNLANYRGDPPKVELGITVKASQQGTPIE